jgi:hypothetical protein
MAPTGIKPRAGLKVYFLVALQDFYRKDQLRATPRMLGRMV